MDQRFSVFFLEKSRLVLQQGAQSFDEDENNSEIVPRSNKLKQLMSHIVTRIMMPSKKFKKQDGVLVESKGITSQIYIE